MPQKLQRESPHFHTFGKGCDIIKEYRGDPKLRNYVRVNEAHICTVHKVEICRCGWRIGYHYGVKNAAKKLRKHIFKRQPGPTPFDIRHKKPIDY